MNVRIDGTIHRYAQRAMPGHIPVHLLWAYGKGRGHLSALQHAHVTACEGCTRALEVCAHEKSFGAVLRELDRARDGLAGKPKLKTLYVFPGPISPEDDSFLSRTD